jgi:hypothetical protein
MNPRLWIVRKAAQFWGNVEAQGSLICNPATETLGGQTVKVLIKDGAGMALLVTGTTIIADGQAGFAKGCLFIDTDVAGGTSGLYVNVGTTASANFDLVTDA